MKQINVIKLVILIAFTLTTLNCQYFSTDSQINYGLNHYKMGLYDRAIPFLLSAVEDIENEEPTDPRLPQVLIALGNMATNKKDEARAEDFFRRALKAAEKLSPVNNVQIRNSLVHLGLFYRARDRAKEAVPLLKRATTISEEATNKVLFAIDLDNLGLAIDQLGRHEEANQLSLKALDVLDSLTPSNEDAKTRGVILYNLAWSYMNQKRYTEAEKLYQKSLALLEDESLGPVENWRIKTILKGYANLLRQTKRIAEANTMESRAEQLR